MDEQHMKLLDPDDWEVLTQEGGGGGGLTTNDRKYRSSRKQEIRCFMFITCQTEMDFGKEHNSAMDARLRKFYFKSLNSQAVPEENSSHCVTLYCECKQSHAHSAWSASPFNAWISWKQNEFDEEEKDRIKTLNLEDSESDNKQVLKKGNLW